MGAFMARLKCGSGRSGGSSPHAKTARAGKTIAFLGIIRLFHGQPPRIAFPASLEDRKAVVKLPVLPILGNR